MAAVNFRVELIQMAGYFIATINSVSDPGALRQYRKAAAPLLRKYDGEVLLSEGNNQQFVECEQGFGVVVIRFPSYDQATAWYNSAEYQNVRKLRLGAIDIHAVISDGAD